MIWNNPDNDPIDIPDGFYPSELKRVDIIKLIAEKINAQRYLEIGVSDGWVYNQVTVPNKIGVEPRPVAPAGVHRLLSDEYFARYDDSNFDIVFVDGMHEYQQVSRDINNGIDRLRPGGFMVMHDMMPKNYYESTVPKIRGKTPAWTGDVWRAAFDLAQRKDITFRLCQIDFGCGILRKQEESHNRHYTPEPTWKYYKENWKKLPLIKFEDIESVYFSKE